MTIPRDRNGNIIPASDWEKILTALTGLPPTAAADLMVTAEARRIARTEVGNKRSSAARSRRTFEQIHDSLRRDKMLTGDPVKDAELVFERERKRDTTRQISEEELAALEVARAARQDAHERKRDSSRKARLAVIARKKQATA